MIDAYQRGVIVGGQHRPLQPLTVAEMLREARASLKMLRDNGYAHLDGPDNGFLSGYVAGYQAAQKDRQETGDGRD
jgi:hypothetical protein